MDKSTPSFLYANGLLLLTIAAVPFPTALMGEYVWTDHAGPAVFIYNAVMAIQAIAWILMSDVSLRNELAKNARTADALRLNSKNAYLATALYSALAVLALWFPRTIAFITASSWVYWLIHGIRTRHED